MNNDKSSISNAKSYRTIGEFWDSHDLADYWEHTEPIEFEVDLQSEVVYYPVDGTLSARMAEIARQHGVATGALLNRWVQEKLQEQESA
jgi:hypothetical protein